MATTQFNARNGLSVGTTPVSILDASGNASFTSASVAANGGITIASGAPGVTTNALYQVGSTLYWNGSTLGGTTLPSQSGNNGKFLTTDGSNLSWATVVGGGGNNSYSATFGDGTNTSYTFSHNLNTTDIDVDVWETTGLLREAICEKRIIDANTVSVHLTSAPATNSLRITIRGGGFYSSPANLSLSDTSASTSTTSGALIVAGGAGFGGTVSTTSLDTNASGTLAIGSTNASTVNIGTATTTQAVNIGTGSGVTTINIGGSGDTVNIAGTLAYVNTTDLNVTDKLITLNKGGAAASGNASGISIEENAVAVASVVLGNSRASWSFTVPAKAGSILLTPSASAYSTELISSATADRQITFPDSTGTVALTSGIPEPDGTSILNTSGILSATPTSIGALASATNDNATSTACYPVWVTAAGNTVSGISASTFTFIPSTGTLNITTLQATGNVIAYNSSDSRLKENIAPLDSPLEKLSKIRGVSFDWTDAYIAKQGGEDGFFVRKHDVGVIAQEIQKVIPEAVGEHPDGYLGVRYEKLVPLLIEAIKAQQVQIDDLKKQIVRLA